MASPRPSPSRGTAFAYTFRRTLITDFEDLLHSLSRYRAVLWAFLKPLGAWGVFLVAAIDGGSIGLPVDAIVVGYVFTDRPRVLAVCAHGMRQVPPWEALWSM